MLAHSLVTIVARVTNERLNVEIITARATRRQLYMMLWEGAELSFLDAAGVSATLANAIIRLGQTFGELRQILRNLDCVQQVELVEAIKVSAAICIIASSGYVSTALIRE